MKSVNNVDLCSTHLHWYENPMASSRLVIPALLIVLFFTKKDNSKVPAVEILKEEEEKEKDEKEREEKKVPHLSISYSQVAKKTPKYVKPKAPKVKFLNLQSSTGFCSHD